MDAEWFRPYEDRTADEALEALNSIAGSQSEETNKLIIQFIQDWNSLPLQVQVENLQGLGGLKHITNEEAKQIILNNSPGNIPPTKLIAIYGGNSIMINFNYNKGLDKLQFYILSPRKRYRDGDGGASICGLNWHEGLDLLVIDKDYDTHPERQWEFYKWDGKSTPFMNWTETPF